MYRYIRSSEITNSRIRKCKKLVRDYIWQCFSQGGEYFNDPEMLSNIEYMKWYDSDEDISWAEYVYKHRHDIFDKYILDKIENDPEIKTEEEQNCMIDYFNNLQPSDYNRILYLKRDSTKDGISNRIRRIREYDK